MPLVVGAGARPWAAHCARVLRWAAMLPAWEAHGRVLPAAAAGLHRHAQRPGRLGARCAGGCQLQRRAQSAPAPWPAGPVPTPRSAWKPVPPPPPKWEPWSKTPTGPPPRHPQPRVRAADVPCSCAAIGRPGGFLKMISISLKMIKSSYIVSMHHTSGIVRRTCAAKHGHIIKTGAGVKVAPRRA